MRKLWDWSRRVWRRALERDPELKTFRARVLANLDLWFIDHGLLRLIGANFAKVDAGLYRSSHPNPWQIKRLRRRGITTILNLRGQQVSGPEFLSAKAAEASGLEYAHIPMLSARPPSKAALRALYAAFSNARGPLLVHCKSGADRTGLASAMYLLVNRGTDVETALHQLSLRYGHFQHSKKGVLRYFIEALAAASPADFLSWVEEEYDPAVMLADFRASGRAGGFSAFWVRHILRRE